MDEIDDQHHAYQPLDHNSTEEIFDLGDGVTITRKELSRVTNYTQRKTFMIDGEVSFRLPLNFHEDTTTADTYEPLTFLRGIGFQRNQAKDILLDPIVYSNIYIVLKEARLWTETLKHSHATLLYEAAVKLRRGRRAAEYICLVTDSIISGNIQSYEDLTAFIKFVNKIDDGVYTWDQVLHLPTKMEIRKIPYMLYQLEVEKVFSDAVALVQQLKTSDDQVLMNMVDNTPLDIKTALELAEVVHSSSSSISSFDSKSNNSEIELTMEKPSVDDKLIRARRVMSQKEITQQCSIFANYYDPSMYKYIPLMAHMIARGYFTHYIQIEAVADFLRPICGMRQVKLTELLRVVLKVANRTDLDFK